MAANPYHPFVSSLAGIIRGGKSLPLGGIPAPAKSRHNPDAPVVIIFSPHPDDECVVGGLPMRLMREGGMRILNIAVTLGSKTERRQARLAELKSACDWLGFESEQIAPEGFERINLKTRTENANHWASAVKSVAATLARLRPKVIFFPHEGDGNTTHIGTHFLVMDALKTMPVNFQCLMVETEFWAPMQRPNLMIESSVDDVADLVAALSFHAGEVQRNPYHLRLPAMLLDNVRRGTELVGGQGDAAPDFMFATLYRLSSWKKGKIGQVLEGGKQIGAGQNITGNFPGMV